MIGGEIGEEFLHFFRGDDRCVDPDFLLVGDVAAQLSLLLARIDLDEACLLKAAFAADAFFPIVEIDLITLECQFRFSGEVVVHTDESAGVTCRARSGHFAFEDGGLESALGEVKGDAGAHHARADDDGVGCLSHGGFLFCHGLPGLTLIILLYFRENQ